MTATRPPIAIPAALEPLTKEQRWVGWRWIKGKDGKPTKPPFRADAPHLHASSTDPSTWSPLEVAMGAYCRGQVDGIGFALSGSEIGAEDLDDCRIAETGVLNPWAAE
jgi:primase-polymerase (primpol)-like protein